MYQFMRSRGEAGRKMEGGGEYQIVGRLRYLTQQCIDLRKHGNHGLLTVYSRGTHGISQGTYLWLQMSAEDRVH
jgi:hypothetical protein